MRSFPSAKGKHHKVSDQVICVATQLDGQDKQHGLGRIAGILGARAYHNVQVLHLASTTVSVSLHISGNKLGNHALINHVQIDLTIHSLITKSIAQ